MTKRINQEKMHFQEKKEEELVGGEFNSIPAVLTRAVMGSTFVHLRSWCMLLTG